MGKLFDLKQTAIKHIELKNLDKVKISGQIGLKAGMMLPFISESTPDDPAKIEALKKGIKEVLGLSLT
jgi:hypothetical protein